MLRKIGTGNKAAFRHISNIGTHILQFPDIPRPIILQQNIGGLLGQLIPQSVSLQKMMQEQEDIVPTFAQCRNFQRKHVEPVKEIHPERMLKDKPGDILVRCRDDTDINRYDFLSAYPHDFLLLEDPQQFCLHIGRDIPKLVQKDRPSVGQFKKPGLPALTGSGKRSLFISKELALDERIRY